MTQRLAAKRDHGFVIQNPAIIGHQTIMAIAVIRIQRHIRDHSEAGQRRLQGLDGPRHETGVVPSLLRLTGLQIVCNAGKQYDRPHPGFPG